MKTEALCFVAPGRVEVRQVEIPSLKANQILVRTKACGVCAADINYFKGGKDVNYPYFGGHEGIGVVEEVGKDVKTVRAGDVVACLGQQCFAPYFIADAEMTACLTTEVKDWAHWLVEPVACAVNAIDYANIRPFDNVVVIGCGFMGCLLIQGLASSVAGTIIAVDIREDRLALAKQCGATAVVNASTGDVQAKLDTLCSGHRQPTFLPNVVGGKFDVAMEASGTPDGIKIATEALRLGGTLCLFGWHHGLTQFDGTQWHVRGLKVLNTSPMISPDFGKVFKAAARLMSTGRFSLEALVTHRAQFPDMSRVRSLFEDALNSERSGYVKGVITF